MDTNNIEKKTNSELAHILGWCSDEKLRNEAGKVLKGNSPTNSELAHILGWCSDEKLRNEAGKVLKGNSPTNSELAHILGWCSDEKLRNEAGKVLKGNVGISDDDINEQELIKKVAENILLTPNRLDMGNWHCGTNHCLAGWACVVDDTVQKIERDHGTEIAGCVALPNYAHLFFSDNDTVLKEMEKVVGLP